MMGKPLSTSTAGSIIVASSKFTPPPRGEPVNVVTAFGAVGDGKTDCTAAVAAAVAFIKSQRPPVGKLPPPGSHPGSYPVPALVFPAGRFVINAPLIVDCFTVEGAGPTTTQLIFSNTKAGSTAGPSAEGGYAVILGTSWNEMRAMGRKFVAAKNLSIVGGSNTQPAAAAAVTGTASYSPPGPYYPNPNTMHGMLLHSCFQGQAAVENVHVTHFCSVGAVGIGLCNVQDICFRSCVVESCYIGLQLSPSTKTEAGDRGNHNTNLLFDNLIAQNCISWGIACLAGQGGCDNVTFVGGVCQSGSGVLVNIAEIGSVGFFGFYFEVVPPLHHELVVTDVTQCVLSNCHFTSIGAMVAVSGASCLEASSCTFASKFCQAPKKLPNGARLSLTNGAQATVIACSPQLSVGTGCKATLIGFDHGGPGKQTGNPITGGGGTILDLSNPPKAPSKDGQSDDDEKASITAGAGRRTSVWAQLGLLIFSVVVLLLAFVVHNMHQTLHQTLAALTGPNCPCDAVR
jgi:hypothetical protein